MATKAMKTTTKPTTVKTNEAELHNVDASADNTETVEEKVEVKVAKQVAPPKPKKYEPDDLIPCRSMYAGTLLFTGDKTKITYEFSNMGDFRYIEYQDLLSALLRRKKSLFAPYIIIEDEELLNGVHWQDVKKVYDGLYDRQDLINLINLPTVRFNDEFRKLPSGYRRTIATMVGEMIADGTFDSMNKIKIIDEVCGTDLKLLSE